MIFFDDNICGAAVRPALRLIKKKIGRNLNFHNRRLRPSSSYKQFVSIDTVYEGTNGDIKQDHIWVHLLVAERSSQMRLHSVVAHSHKKKIQETEKSPSIHHFNIWQLRDHRRTMF